MFTFQDSWFMWFMVKSWFVFGLWSLFFWSFLLDSSPVSSMVAHDRVCTVRNASKKMCKVIKNKNKIASKWDAWLVLYFSFVLFCVWIYYVFYFVCEYIMSSILCVNILCLLFCVWIYYVFYFACEYIMSSILCVNILCLLFCVWIYYVFYFVCEYIMSSILCVNILCLLFCSVYLFFLSSSLA